MAATMANSRAQSSTRWPSYVAAGPFLFFSGQMGRDASTGALLTRYGALPPQVAGTRSDFDWVADLEAPVGAQAIAIYERYRALLAKEGGELGHLLRYHIYQHDKRHFPVFDRVRRAYEPAPPASTALGVRRLEPTGVATTCIDGIALRPFAETVLGPRTVLRGALAHAAAHYSHVIGAGHFLFIAGQIPIDVSKPGSPLVRSYEDVPEDGRVLSVGRSHEDSRNGPIAAQTWFVYDLIQQHLEAQGASMECVLNLTVYLQDMRDFPTFHRVHERFFRSKPPALTVIEAREVGHKGSLIEVEPTAIVPMRKARRTVLEPKGWRAPAQMSAIVHANGLAFLSGVTGVEGTGEGDAYTLQATAAIAEIERRLDAARSNLEHIVHLTVYIDDISQLPSVETVLDKALGTHRPAFTAVEVPGPAPVAGARLSMTAIGWFGDEVAVAVY